MHNISGKSCHFQGSMNYGNPSESDFTDYMLARA